MCGLGFLSIVAVIMAPIRVENVRWLRSIKSQILPVFPIPFSGVISISANKIYQNLFNFSKYFFLMFRLYSGFYEILIKSEMYL